MTIQTPEDFAAEARRIMRPLFGSEEAQGLDAQVRRLLLIANEYAAAAIEQHARTPQATTDRAVRLARAQVGEEIARSIETLLCEPGEHCQDKWCPDCIRYRQAQDDASTARRIGQTQLYLEGAAQ